MLIVDQRIRDDGSLEAVTLEWREGALWVGVGGAPPAVLPGGALDGVMRRYGKPLAAEVAVDGPSLDLGDGRTLVRMRHLARYDVVAKDFLVYRVPGEDPIAELAVTVTAALLHLVRVSAGHAG